MKFVKASLLACCFLSMAFSALAGPILINELMYHPSSENNLEEYVELFNAGTNAVSLKGWRFTAGIRFMFPNVSLAPGEYLVVAANEAAFTNKYPAVINYVAGWDGILSNSGQLLELADAQGQRADSVRYADDGDWAVRGRDVIDYGHRGWAWLADHDGFGPSLELINPALPNHHGQNWSTSKVAEGTPGQVNSVWRNNLAPLILELKHFPLIPKSNDPITITARILDEQTNGLAVALHHRIDGATNFTPIVMFDDGKHGDGLANDEIFGVVLPAHTNQTILEFYVETRDDADLTRTWPHVALQSDSSLEQTANALLQVDDSPVYAGSQPFYRVTVTAAELAELRQINANSPKAPYDTHDQTLSHAIFNATFISFDGTGTELRYLVGVRNRGNGSKSIRPQSYKINFLQTQPWKKTTGLNLNTQNTHAQLAGSAIFRRAGVAAAEARPVQVRVNGINLCAPDAPTSGTPNFGYCAHLAAWGSELAARHFPNDSSGNIYRAQRLAVPGANLSFQGADPAPYRTNYFKFTNISADDWTDLIEFTRVLNETTEADYVGEVRRVMEVEEWLRYFAVNTLLENNETSLANGDGDDYYMYRGAVDPRFKILPYDLDTILGQGNTPGRIDASLFRATERSNAGNTSPAMQRFLKHPAFVPLYYQTLQHLIETIFSTVQINPLLDQTLRGLVPDERLDSMKAFASQRSAYVLSQIPLRISVSNDLATVSGFPRTTNATVLLHGLANVIDTRSVLVNGSPAAWSAWEGKWTNYSVALKPGINRVLVQTLDTGGREFDRNSIDIWYDDNRVQNVSGNISVDTIWGAASGPYNVAASLTVASGATLTIEPGTTVYLGSGVNFTVANGGRLLAEGTATAPIRFSVAPGSVTSWGGLIINGAIGSPETRIAYAHFEGNGATCIEVAGGTLHLDHATFGTTTHQYLALDGSSFLVSNCVFPASTAAFELVHGTGGIKAGGRGIVRECFFGNTSSYNDMMDFTGGNRPSQPIIQFYNNVFIGATDDMLDLDGTDAWVEGNIFLHCHRNGSPDSAAAVSGGDNGSSTSQITIIGNLFFDCDQAATAKQGNFSTLINNTIVRITKASGADTASGVVNVCDVDPGPPTTFGAGFYLEGNIIVDAEALVRNYVASETTVTFNNNILPFVWDGPGSGNVVTDPRLKHIPQLAETQFTSWEQAQVMRDWFSLRPGSPAIGTGPNGRDQGGVIPFGASISGEPAGTTFQNSATLTVGTLMNGFDIPTAGFPYGSGFTHYQWKLDNGVFSTETPTATPIMLSGLANGPHTVTVIGKNDALYYQNDPALGPDAVLTTSRTWTVDTSYSRLLINEVLAKNTDTFLHGTNYPDVIELFNHSATSRDLTGLGLSDNETNRYRFTFPSGTAIEAGGYLIVFAEGDTNAPGLHTGFALKQTGESLLLYDRAANGGALLDSVTFGLQLPDLTIGRLADGHWALTLPTLGSANIPYPIGDPHTLKINEWLADARRLFSTGFIELFNPDPQPVGLGGLFLTGNPVGAPTQHAIALLSFIAGNGFAIFKTDNDPEQGPDHLNFSLLPEQGEIGLRGMFDNQLEEIDTVLYRSQTTDVSEGRSPTGSSNFVTFNQPTPGASNPGNSGAAFNISTLTTPLIVMTNAWKFNQAGTDLGTLWRATNYNDASWPSGHALFYHPTSENLLAPKNTFLMFNNPQQRTYYFRTHFSFEGDPTGLTLTLSHIIDDGAVMHLNGQEFYRFNMPDGTIRYTNFARSTVGTATLQGPFTVPSSRLVQGDNVLAVEVHQINAISSDIVFGITLASAVTVANSVSQELPLVLNEILAHNATLTNAAGAASDWVELFNPNTNAVDLADLSLTDDSTVPRRWMFPAGATIPAEGFLVLEFNPSAPVSSTNTGFGLEANGNAVYLFDRGSRGGLLIDAVSFGLQVADFSLGRIPSGEGNWTLNAPTRSAPNTAAGLDSVSELKINEWLANPATSDDWFEIFNPNSRPVELSGLFLSDDLNNRDQFSIAPLSFIGAGVDGFVKFDADGNTEKGAGHVNFKLDAKGESIGLFTTYGVLLDSITFGPQDIGVSEGRLPDGSADIVSFRFTATPGGANTLSITDSDGDGLPDTWERTYGLNPRDAADALLDNDGDGLTNAQEFLIGTNPRDTASALMIESVTPASNGGWDIRFPVVGGRTYSLQYRDSLTEGEWVKLKDFEVQDNTQTVEFFDSLASASTARFYRLATPNLP